MKTKQEQHKEFQKLYLTGKYTQKDISLQVGITEATATAWVKKMSLSVYIKISRQLITQLELLTKNYNLNRELITNLISDIERIEKLKAKYISQLIHQ